MNGLRSEVDGGFEAVEAAARAAVGARLFTVLAVDAERGVLSRIHTSHPDEYPVGGEKVMPMTDPWPQQVIVDQQPYLGLGTEAVAAVFSDHDTIAALGCDETLNVPVVHDGRTLGVLNLLDADGAYDERSIRAARHLPALAVGPLLDWHAAHHPSSPPSGRSAP